MPPTRIVAEASTSPSPRKRPVLKRRAQAPLISSDSESDPESVPARPQLHVKNVHYSKRTKLEAKNKPAPNKILTVQKAQYEKAMKILDGPPLAHYSYPDQCTHHLFTTATVKGGAAPPEHIMTDSFMFQEITNCLEQGDLDGLLAIASGAFPTRKQVQLKNDMYCAALYALHYHPAANDPEIFKRCIESLFNTRTLMMGSSEAILKTISKTFAFESEFRTEIPLPPDDL